MKNKYIKLFVLVLLSSLVCLNVIGFIFTVFGYIDNGVWDMDIIEKCFVLSVFSPFVVVSSSLVIDFLYKLFNKLVLFFK
ncbi:hypothetical protein NYR77_01500 [Actinobacillus equuli subsp. haemolyticus]|uniref:Uncharacterized protein n=1 Tax=Actinobacillus equuli TaxID=718 RepID=A0AAX3FHL0_ACTEU|nr:hypothetical protein [Actinobacillus equuli]AIZ79495.1 hypothetical protein ACEE_06850 [Actinobacillus equuli subsp. equuli]WGE43608.1 hypothetical protein NYR65_06730 [Actinobacillus equuli subsp. equuli]WGE56328.1 hypothetical protein NYR71_06225 [Actinobacillus equuli subsp. equuli]WGE67732.1 hypothetical protein NYR77_01500 [Actinobacillus equuli subsp. haemolyticus]VEE90062.1 Uncharacterised protein [Actinobacillus equuli]